MGGGVEERRNQISTLHPTSKSTPGGEKSYMRKEKVLEHKIGEFIYIIGVEKNLTKHKQQKPKRKLIKKTIKIKLYYFNKKSKKKSHKLE